MWRKQVESIQRTIQTRYQASVSVLAIALFLVSCASSSTSVEPMLQQASVSVVAVGRDGANIGTAWAVGPGLFVSNAHVASDSTIYLRAANGRSHGVKDIVRDAELDLALLRSALQMPSLKLAPRDPALGSEIYVLGNPFGQGLSVSRGIVGALPGALVDIDLMQLDASVNPGNSGGPVVNVHGEVVGIVSQSGPLGSGLGFAVPVETLRSWLNEHTSD